MLHNKGSGLCETAEDGTQMPILTISSTELTCVIPGHSCEQTAARDRHLSRLQKYSEPELVQHGSLGQLGKASMETLSS